MDGAEFELERFLVMIDSEITENGMDVVDDGLSEKEEAKEAPQPRSCQLLRMRPLISQNNIVRPTAQSYRQKIPTTSEYANPESTGSITETVQSANEASHSLRFVVLYTKHKTQKVIFLVFVCLHLCFVAESMARRLHGVFPRTMQGNSLLRG